MVRLRGCPRWLTGGPDAATAILETIAISMVSLAALVLTITMVVVQLAMGQFSPRIIQTFLRDRPSQVAIGLFVATFAHATLTMREVQFADGGPGTGGRHRRLWLQQSAYQAGVITASLPIVQPIVAITLGLTSSTNVR